MNDPTPSLHPAQNRGLRELYATARNLAGHWEWLAEQFDDGEPRRTLEKGAGVARTLMEELPPVLEPHNLFVGKAARNAGASLSGLRSGVSDRFLERNQAVRAAVLDAQHLVTLLRFQSELAKASGPEDVAEFCARWEKELVNIERAARRVAVKLAQDPDAAIEPLDDSRFGRAAHGIAYWTGTAGEWFDRRRS